MNTVYQIEVESASNTELVAMWNILTGASLRGIDTPNLTYVRAELVKRRIRFIEGKRIATVKLTDKQLRHAKRVIEREYETSLSNSEVLEEVHTILSKSTLGANDNPSCQLLTILRCGNNALPR